VYHLVSYSETLNNMMLTRNHTIRDTFVTQDDRTFFKEMLHEFADEDWEYSLVFKNTR